jgi:hypothetical protein
MNPSILAGAASALLLATVASPLGAQASQGFPVISTRQFTGGSAKVTVTGSFSISEDVPINTQASFGDGTATWLQFGNSGSDTPNALITYGESKEIGITIGRGKLIATGGIMPGEASACSGKAEVTAKLVSGRYTCKGVSSYDPATSKMGKVDIEITFTAKS